MFNLSIKVIKEIKEHQDKENIWANSIFESMNTLKADYSGKVGEEVFFNFLKENTSWDIVYDSDKNINTGDGVYDGLVNGKRVEVKTARLGTSNSFQHENLKNNVCDHVVFLDYNPNYFFITVVDFQNINLNKSHPILGIRPHKRKDTNNVYKLDLKESSSLKKAIKGEICIKIDEHTEKEDIIQFLSKFFI